MGPNDIYIETRSLSHHEAEVTVRFKGQVLFKGSLDPGDDDSVRGWREELCAKLEETAPMLLEKLSQELDTKVQEALEALAAANEKAWTWPELIPLQGSLPPLPKLPVDVFRGWLGDYIAEVAAQTETPIELAAGLGLAVVATAAQRRFRIRVKPWHFEPLNLWVAVALESGNRKSAVLNAMVAPLVAWERAKIDVLKPEMEKRRAQRKVVEARIAQATRQAGKSKSQAERKKIEDEIEGLRTGMPEDLVMPRLFTGDCTPERLGSLMAENDDCMSWISDEGGIVELMAGRYSGGIPNLDLFLQGHAGSPVRVDRGGRDPVLLDAPALSMALSPQPDVLYDLGTNRTFRGRGLVARFLFLLPKSLVGYRTGDTPDPDPFLGEAYAAGVRALLDHPGAGDDGQDTWELYLSPDAREMLLGFAQRIEKQMRPGGPLEHLKDWGSKLAGAAARIAGILHLADQVWAGEVLNEHRLEVGVGVMERAIALAEVFLAHVLAVFGQILVADPRLAAAQRLLGWIRRKGVSSFKRKDVLVDRVFPSVDVLLRPLATLEEHGYIVPQETPKPPGPGRRPSPTYYVNPATHEEGFNSTK